MSHSCDRKWNRCLKRYSKVLKLDTINPPLNPGGLFAKKNFKVGAYSKFYIFLENWTRAYNSFSTKTHISINFNFFTIININNKFCWCHGFDFICIESKRIFFLLGALWSLICSVKQGCHSLKQWIWLSSLTIQGGLFKGGAYLPK